jgi:hypothetical protein
MALQKFELALQAPWICNIVSVDSREVLASSPAYTLVQPRGQSFVLFSSDDNDARIVERGGNLRGIIRRAIVDDEQFPIHESLIENGTDSLRDGSCRIEYGHAYGDQMMLVHGL